MGWQEIIAGILVLVCAWALGRKLIGKAKGDAACEHCLPDNKERKPRD